ncbi:DUF418 domain-containing protein [Ornithinimicrobium sp. Y1694]|uniref:DUF418 domain-containing protein n=1 Tax=Ornithinimicrobium sp. Y1694 TaxID=3418590 RepID=UPI003CE97C4E
MSDPAVPAPVTPGRRLGGLDAARGLAILGMIIVNVGPTNPDTVLQRLYLLPFGRASILFVTIAGVGMGYFLRSRRGRHLWTALSWRVLLLFVLGVALQSLTDRVNVILQTYALLFLLAPLLGRLSSRVLLGLGVVVLVAGPSWIVSHEITERWGHALEGITFTTAPGDAVHSLILTGPYPLASWTVPFIAGLLLARVDLSDPDRQRRMVWRGGATALLAFLVADVAYAALGPEADQRFSRIFTGVGHGQMPLWLISSIGGAVFVIGGCQRLCQTVPWTTAWLARCGVLAFTMYVLHVVVLAAVKPADGFTFGRGLLVALLFNVVAVILGALWARTNRPGPLEWLLRHPWLRSRTPRGAGETVTTPEGGSLDARGVLTLRRCLVRATPRSHLHDQAVGDTASSSAVTAPEKTSPDDTQRRRASLARLARSRWPGPSPDDG